MHRAVLIGLGVLAILLGSQGAVQADTYYTKTTCDPCVLWPPNHKYVDINVSVQAVGGWNLGSWTVVGVTSNQADDAVGTGDGSTVDDILITGQHTVKARAERDGTDKDGRTYTIKVLVNLWRTSTCYYSHCHCTCSWFCCYSCHYHPYSCTEYRTVTDTCTVYGPHSQGQGK